MLQNKSINSKFNQGLEKLGFEINDENFLLIKSANGFFDPQINFHIEKANEFQATAVYLRRQLNGSYKPQVYIYDYTGKGFEENELTEIHKKIWSSGEAPLACIFYDTDIKILDCTRRINDDNTPSYLVKSLLISAKVHKVYNDQFAVKIKSGTLWEEEEFKNKFKFQNSSYDFLIAHLKNIIKEFDKTSVDSKIAHKLIIQSILIKYLEERVDQNGNRVFSKEFFSQFNKATSFCDVLRKKGQCLKLFDELHSKFNGNIFDWSIEKERQELKKADLSELANLLDANVVPQTRQISIWRYYAFNYVPVELISRLYEEFLGEDKQEKGLFYTPSHLAKLLVDETMPLNKYKEIDLDSYKILDPACGSGVFLVIAYKRLIQWWRLKNNLERPKLADLKKLLHNNIFGVDMEHPAVRLSAFSLCLALCDELTPMQIIEELRFEDLTQNNIINSDFFACEKLSGSKFDLIIGNPPFSRGAISNYDQNWQYDGDTVKIPQGQIALKFLSDSLIYLKEKGLQCLIIKSSGLLYNTSSESYKKILFSKLNVIQVLDFTALARNKSLWDNGADVDAAAIFIKNEKPNFNRNILHITFRRTKATKERIVFEIDEYDLHFVNRQVAIENNFIWKNNLLGGGRVKSVVEKLNEIKPFDKYLLENNCVAGEGYITGTNGTLNPKFIFDIPTLPTEAITETGINYSELKSLNKKLKFVKVSEEIIFNAPNIIIWENIGVQKLPVFFNKKSFSFKHKIIGIASEKSDSKLLKSIVESFDKYSDLYRFHVFATSSQLLINKNTALLKADIMKLPFIVRKNSLSDFDNNVIQDVNTYMQDFVRHGEKSEAVKPIKGNLISIIKKYGSEFSKVLNLIYENKSKKFRLSDVVSLCDNSYIATVFKYDSKDIKTKFHNDNSEINITALTDQEISKYLNLNRIIKLYPQKDTVIFIKPNQYRYWLSLIAYRDADKCFSDFSNQIEE